VVREKIIAALQKVLVTEGKYELAAILRELLDYLAAELDFDFTNDQDVLTHFGKALNARASAQGLRYPFRTKKYLLATLKALENPQVKEVLYLGTGPFAPFFVFPILLGYTQARFTLVEVNPYSVAVMRKLIDRLELSPYVTAILQQDAAVWQVDRHYDLVTSEINDVGMKREDSFAVFQNIYRQLPAAHYIPKDIFLYLKTEAAFEDKAAPGDYYDSLTDGFARGYLRTDCPYPATDRPLLQTRVLVDEEIVLEPDESVITKSVYFYSL